MADQETGTVKWFDDKKGFGFIQPDDGSKDCFVHYSDVLGTGRKTLHEGQRVTFEKEEGHKGPQAKDVSPA